MPYDLPNTIEICHPKSLYRWAKVWGKVQKSYYNDQVCLRREKQLRDFIYLNQFKNIYIEKDTDVFNDFLSVKHIDQADLVLITDQKFSRMPCHGIIERINDILLQCPNLLLCLNRHYINIDNSCHDTTLDDNFTLAIVQWLKKNLPEIKILDLSLDYLDKGDWFTWVIPDRIYFIQRS